MTTTVRLQQRYEAAARSRYYQVLTDENHQWVMPRHECTFDENLDERPTYVRCWDCGDILVYTQRKFGDWSLKHGSGACKARRLEAVGQEFGVVSEAQALAEKETDEEA